MFSRRDATREETISARGWLEIDIERSGSELRARSLGSRSEQPGLHSLGPGHTEQSLQALGEHLKAAAERGRPLDPELSRQVQALHQALFQGDIKAVLARLREAAAGEPVLLRLMLQETDLQGFPWEALCEPGTDFEFLGNSASLLPVRGVRSPEPWQPREVRGAVSLLAIAPLHPHVLPRLQGTLHESLASGELEWLTPLTGLRARRAALFERLRRQPEPHIVHFIGHGGLQDGRPVLRLADKEEGEESWVPVELLAQQLHRAFGKGPLRLIILESCEGASPGTLASAAELLARTAADAVIAYLWPVKVDVALRCSRAFYRALTHAAQQEGDVALSLNEARRSVLAELEGSAEAFAPVLYLRGRDPVLFDFKARRVSPPPPVAPRPETSLPDPALARLLEGPFSLLLGDRWEEEDPILHGLRERLQGELSQKAGAVPPQMPLSTLAQHFALRIGQEELDYEFQEVFGPVDFIPPLVGLLARRLGPGVHVTLLRLPVLEQALAEQHPELTIHVIQPSSRVGGHAVMMRREANGGRWERLHQAPLLDTEREVVVLRLCAGYLPAHLFSRPLLTEDDYLPGVRGLESLLSQELAAPIQSVLSLRPLLLVGLSLLSWHHRVLLYQLFGRRALLRDSVAVLDTGTHEQELWEEGRGLPGRTGVRALESTDEALSAWLQALAAGGDG